MDMEAFSCTHICHLLQPSFLLSHVESPRDVEINTNKKCNSLHSFLSFTTFPCFWCVFYDMLRSVGRYHMPYLHCKANLWHSKIMHNKCFISLSFAPQTILCFCQYVCVWSTFIMRIMDILFQISSHGILSIQFSKHSIMIFVVHHHFFLGSFPFGLHMMGLLCLISLYWFSPSFVICYAPTPKFLITWCSLLCC
jgi:hypothetical protein